MQTCDKTVTKAIPPKNPAGIWGFSYVTALLSDFVLLVVPHCWIHCEKILFNLATLVYIQYTQETHFCWIENFKILNFFIYHIRLRQSPIFLLLTRNFLLDILCKYGNFSSFSSFHCFIVPVDISVTVFSNPSKLTNFLFILWIEI